MWDFYLGWCEGAFREYYIDAAQLVMTKRREEKREPAAMDEAQASVARA
jgi:hypothetical protein